MPSPATAWRAVRRTRRHPLPALSVSGSGPSALSSSKVKRSGRAGCYGRSSAALTTSVLIVHAADRGAAPAHGTEQGRRRRDTSRRCARRGATPHDLLGGHQDRGGRGRDPPAAGSDGGGGGAAASGKPLPATER